MIISMAAYGAITTDSFRVDSIDPNIAGLLADTYTDIFFLNPAYIKSEDSKTLYLNIKNPDSKISGAYLKTSENNPFGCLFDYSYTRTPLQVFDVNGNALDLNNDGINDTGKAAGGNTQLFDNGLVPLPGRLNALTPGGTAGDQIFDRSVGTYQEAEHFTTTSQYNAEFIHKIFGLPFALLIQSNDTAETNNSSKLVDNVNLVTNQMINSQSTDKTSLLENSSLSYTLLVANEIAKSDTMRWGYHGGLLINSTSGVGLNLRTPSGSIFSLSSDQDARTTVSNNWDLTTSAGPMDNFSAETKINTPETFYGIVLGLDSDKKLSDTTYLRCYVDNQYKISAGYGSASGPLADGGAGGLITNVSTVMPGALITNGKFTSWDAAGDIYTVNNNENNAFSVNQWQDSLRLASGVEYDFASNALFTCGAKLTALESGASIGSTQTTIQDSKYDLNGNGSLLDAGDRERVTTQTNLYNVSTRTSQYSIALPYGVEVLLKDWLKLRFGGDHLVVYTLTTADYSATYNGLAKTVTTVGNGTSTPTVTTAYTTVSTTKAPARDVQESVDTTDTVNAGLGFDLTKNLFIDVMFSTNLSVAVLADWYVQGIYRF